MENNTFEKKKISIGKSRGNSLSSALAAMDFDDANRTRDSEMSDEDAQVQDRCHPSLTVEPLEDRKFSLQLKLPY